MASRYWRVLIGRNNGDSFKSIGEIELRESEGGADATGSGTASASSSFSGSFNADKVFDNSNSTWWSSTNGASFPQWVKYDFGAGNEKDIVELALTSLNNADQAQSPRDYSLQFSASDRDWETGAIS